MRMSTLPSRINKSYSDQILDHLWEQIKLGVPFKDALFATRSKYKVNKPMTDKLKEAYAANGSERPKLNLDNSLRLC